MVILVRAAAWRMTGSGGMGAERVAQSGDLFSHHDICAQSDLALMAALKRSTAAARPAACGRSSARSLRQGQRLRTSKNRQRNRRSSNDRRPARAGEKSSRQRSTDASRPSAALDERSCQRATPCCEHDGPVGLAMTRFGRGRIARQQVFQARPAGAADLLRMAASTALQRPSRCAGAEYCVDGADFDRDEAGSWRWPHVARHAQQTGVGSWAIAHQGCGLRRLSVR